MASIEWRKDGLDIQLPGDDPHISVQVGIGSRGRTPGKPKASPNDLADNKHIWLQFRGGPQKFEVTSWLQIQALRPSDEGTYHCLARNALGQVEASATLTVLTLGKGALSSELWAPGPLNSWKE